MSLSDLFFGTDVVNRTGRNNIRGDELAAMINAQGASPQIGKGALVTVAGFVVPIAAGADVIFDTIDYDDLSFFSLGSPTLFTIPTVSPAITRVYFSIVVQWTPSSSGDFVITQVLKTPFISFFPGTPLDIRSRPSVITGPAQSISGGPVQVTAGDSFSLRLATNGAVGEVTTRINFSIWVAR